jgi:hypothetical protein
MTSKIKVDNIANQSDSNIVNKCSTTITVGTGSDTTNVPGAAVVTGNVTGANVIASGNVVKSNALQASDGGVIISQSGTTITLGASGDTVSLASGASQSGFGRTGTVDWQTGDIKTSTFTAVNGQGFFVDTNGGEVTANLPAGSAGAIVSFQDYRNNFQTNNFIISPNGSEKINTGAGPVTLNTEGEGATLVYIDSTVGWRSIQDNAFADEGAAFIEATGGTVTTVCTNFKVHTFTGPGTFAVSNAGAPAGSTTVDYLVVAGGGGGGGGLGGGGGAGGYRESGGTASGCYTVSPLGSSPSSVAALPVSVQSYPITVGGGGTGRTSPGGAGGNGNPSIFSSITSTAGGGGGTVGTPPKNSGSDGGSGGGGGGQNPETNGGSGNNPPTSPPQGNNGGVANPSPTYFGGGGGGALEVGRPGIPPASPAIGVGGGGATSSINGTPTARAGGGGGGGDGPAKSGGSGGGGAGGAFSQGTGTAGTTNTGGGGGGGSGGGPTGGDGAAGGSGIVIIRYRFQ